MIKDNKSLVYFVMIFVTFIWGVNMPIMKIGLLYLPPMPYNAARMLCALVATLLFTVITKSYRPLDRKDIKTILLVSIGGFFVFQLFLTAGVQKTTAGNGSLIMALLPVSVAIINKICKIEEISRFAMAGIICSLLGIVLIVAGSSKEISFADEHIYGALLLLGAQASYGYYTVFSKDLLQKYSTYQITMYIVLISTALFCLTAWPSIAATSWREVPLAAWGSILYSGVFALCICNFLWIWSVGKAGSIKASIYNNLSPIFAIIGGYLLLGETFSLLQFFGAAIIFLGIYLARKK
ncbi:MAG: carboxylate/amino acid/amine transporter [Firmicutes bacterium]|nr:carboxylate/amino acid/amine transporter [Bacillota bacterium]